MTQENMICEDEINLLEYAYVLVKGKWFIIGMTIFGLIAGYISAMIIGPSWVADTVIAPKESESVSMPNLSGMGMFGGMVASQLNVGGNASLDKIESLLNSRTFNEKFVTNKKIDSILAPLIYPTIWDTTKKSWHHDTLAPKPISVGNFIKTELLEKDIDKKGTMSLKITTKDSIVSYIILVNYLEFLDRHIRETTQEDAKENRDYLEKQLLTVSDPLLRAKFQEMIAKEVEKMMLVSKEAFSVVDEVLVEGKFKEKILYPLILAFLCFALSMFIIILKHALTSSQKNTEDQQYIDNIKKLLFKPPFKK